MALTDTQLKALKPRAARYMVSDGNGLSMDVLPSGKMSWLYRYRQNGKQEKVILGRYPDLSLKKARKKRDEHAADVAKGKSPAQEKKLARQGLATDPTVQEFGERYYADQVLPRWKDPKQMRRYLDTKSAPPWEPSGSRN